jgi:hypothetical protein
MMLAIKCNLDRTSHLIKYRKQITSIFLLFPLIIYLDGLDVSFKAMDDRRVEVHIANNECSSCTLPSEFFSCFHCIIM